MHVVRVTDLASGTLAYQSPQAAVPAEDPRPVGWLTDADLAVAVNRFVTPSQGYGDGATFALLVVDVSSGRTSTILTAGQDAKVNDFQAARDVLAADRVRHARAPDQPLWDLRTLLPMVVGWFAANSIAEVMLLLALLAGVVAFARRSRRHGRVAG
jgi:hypothetical protein